MDFSDLMIIGGVAVLSAALRTVRHVVAQRLSLLCLVATSYLAGLFLFGNVLGGVALALSWAFLPWLELLTNVRSVRLPVEKNLEPASPPNREEFPTFNELSADFEDEGFTHVEDLCWEWQDMRQFFRVFSHEVHPFQGTICLLEQRGMTFYYVSISARGADGTQWTTWNYPFAYSLKLPPHMKVNRLRGDGSILELLTAHSAFLDRHHIALDSLQRPDSSTFILGAQHDQRQQIDHNLKAGVLSKNAEGEIQYSWRGLFYLWWQFLRDLVRFS